MNQNNRNAWNEEDGIQWRLDETTVEFRFIDDEGIAVIEGAMKWDGCVNWETNPTLMMHFCTLDNLQDLVRKFRRVAEITASKFEIGDIPTDWPAKDTRDQGIELANLILQSRKNCEGDIGWRGVPEGIVDELRVKHILKAEEVVSSIPSKV